MVSAQTDGPVPLTEPIPTLTSDTLPGAFAFLRALRKPYPLGTR